MKVIITNGSSIATYTDVVFVHESRAYWVVHLKNAMFVVDKMPGKRIEIEQ